MTDEIDGRKEDDLEASGIGGYQPPPKKRKRKKRGSRKRGAPVQFTGNAKRREMAQVRLNNAQIAFQSAVATYAPASLKSVWHDSASDSIDLSTVRSQDDVLKILQAAIQPMLISNSNVFVAFKQASLLNSMVVIPCSHVFPLTRFYVAGALLMAWTRRVPELLMGESRYIDCFGRCPGSWTGLIRNTLDTGELVAWAAGMNCGPALRAQWFAILRGSSVEFSRRKLVVDDCINDVLTVCQNLLLAYSGSPSHSDFCSSIALLKDEIEKNTTESDTLVKPITLDENPLHETRESPSGTDYRSRLSSVCKEYIKKQLNSDSSLCVSPMSMLEKVYAEPLAFVTETSLQNPKEGLPILFGIVPDDTAFAESWLQSVAKVCSEVSADGFYNEAQLLIKTLETDGTASKLKASCSTGFKEFRGVISQFISKAFLSISDGPEFTISEDRLLLLPSEDVHDAVPLQSTLNKLRGKETSTEYQDVDRNSIQMLICCSLFSKITVLKSVLQLVWNNNYPGLIKSLSKPLLSNITRDSSQSVILDILIEQISSQSTPGMDVGIVAQKLADLISVIDQETLVNHDLITKWIIERMQHSTIFLRVVGLCARLFSPSTPDFAAALNWLVKQSVANEVMTSERDIAQISAAALVNTFHSPNSTLLLLLDPETTIEQKLFICSFNQEPSLQDSFVSQCRERVKSAGTLSSEKSGGDTAEVLVILEMLRLCLLAGSNANSFVSELLKDIKIKSQKHVVMALATLLGCSTEREFNTCTAFVLPAITSSCSSISSSKPSLLFEAFWLAHQPTTRTVLDHLRMAISPPINSPCINGVCDAFQQPTTTEQHIQSCSFFLLFVKELQTWPCKTYSDAIECHRCACLLHRCCKAQHPITTESLCVATLQTIISFSMDDDAHFDIQQIQAIHQQSGVASDPKLSSLLQTVISHPPR